MAQGQSEQSRIVAIFYMPNGKAENRYMPAKIKDQGWQTWIENHCVPLAELGYRRFIIHTPFGRTDDAKAYQFDQAKSAHEQGQSWLLDSFVKDWRTFTRREDVDEVIGYLGSLAQSPGITSLVTREQLGALNFRLAASVFSIQDAGMTVAFDAIHDRVPVDGWMSHFVQMVDAQQRAADMPGAYMEPRPRKWFTLGKRLNVICEYPYWNRSDPEKHSDSSGMATKDITGEIILISKHSGENYLWRFDWETARAREIVAAGHSVALTASEYARYGWTPNDILATPIENADGLIGHWNVAESGKYVRDKSGRHNHGFNRPSGGIEVGRRTELERGDGDWTIEIRCRTRNISANATLVSNGAHAPGHKGYWLWTSKTGQVRAWAANGTNYIAKLLGGNINDGQWHKIKWVMDRDKESTLSVDGKVVARSLVNDPNDLTRWNDTLTIGTSYAEGSDVWPGDIGEVKLYEAVID